MKNIASKDSVLVLLSLLDALFSVSELVIFSVSLSLVVFSFSSGE